MQNPRPGIGLVSNVIPEVPVQLLVNPLSLHLVSIMSQSLLQNLLVNKGLRLLIIPFGTS